MICWYGNMGSNISNPTMGTGLDFKSEANWMIWNVQSELNDLKWHLIQINHYLINFDPVDCGFAVPGTTAVSMKTGHPDLTNVCEPSNMKAHEALRKKTPISFKTRIDNILKRCLDDWRRTCLRVQTKQKRVAQGNVNVLLPTKSHK
jgi:hypothetical protein